MRDNLAGLALLALSVIVGPVACGGGGPTSPSSEAVDTSATLSFTVAPIDASTIQYIVPLGNLNPWAHTLPTDHAYVYHQNGPGTVTPLRVVAPAAGTVVNTYPGTNGEIKIWIKVNSRYTYYFDHVVPAGGIATGSKLEAGGTVGTSTGVAFDFAVTDFAVTQSFLTPARYGQDTIYARSPWPYFTEPLRSALYAKVRRIGSDLDGRINYDVAGTLSGNWFADDLAIAQSSGNDISIGGRQIAFARDSWFPDRQRVSIGGLGFSGVYGLSADAPDFTSITPGSGLVTYRLMNTGEPGGPPGLFTLGLLLVQLTDATHLKVEVVADPQATSASFSGNAKIYVR